MRTSEQLEEYFKKFKEKKDKQKQLQREKNKKQLQELYKNVDKALQREKKEKTDKLINSLKQLNPAPKETTTKTIIIPTTGEFYDENLYHTREELQEWERKHYPCIQWDNWDRIIEKTKQSLQLLF